MHALWKLLNPRESVWKLCYQKVIKSHRGEKVECDDKVLPKCVLLLLRLVRKTLAVAMSNGESAPVAGGSARRRHKRRLRCFMRHDKMIVCLAVATAIHHSAYKPFAATHADACTQTLDHGAPAAADSTIAQVIEYVAPAPAATNTAPSPVIEHVTPAPAVTDAEPASVIENVAPAPLLCNSSSSDRSPAIEYVARALTVTFSALSPLIEYVAPTLDVTCEEPAPVIEYVALAPAVTYTAPAPVIDVAPSPGIEYIAPAPFAPNQQSLPAFTVATVTTDVSLDLTGLANPQCSITAVEATAPQVVGSPFPWMSLLRPRTTKPVRNRSLPSKIVYNNTHLNKLCTCQSL